VFEKPIYFLVCTMPIFQKRKGGKKSVLQLLHKRE